MKQKLSYVGGALLLAMNQTAFAETSMVGGVPLLQIPPPTVQPREAPRFEVQTPALAAEPAVPAGGMLDA